MHGRVIQGDAGYWRNVSHDALNGYKHTHTHTHMVDLSHGATVPVFEDLDFRNPQTLSPGAKPGRDFQKSAP